MIRRRLALCFLLMASLPASTLAQKESKKQDSYKSFKSRTSRQQIQVLLREAESLRLVDPSKALTNVQEALASSIANGDTFNEAKSYSLLGNINGDIGEWQLAKENFTRAHNILASEYSKDVLYGEVLSGLGKSCLMLGLYDEALGHFNKALTSRLPAAAKNELRIDISEVYYQKGSYDEALAALEIQSGKIAIDKNKGANPDFDLRVQNQLAKIYARKNDIPRTQQSYSNSLETARETKGEQPQRDAQLQSATNEIAEALRDNKQYDDEIILRNKSVEYNLEKNNLAEASKDKIKISESLNAKGDRAAALKELEGAVAIADTIADASVKADAYRALAESYFQNGDMNKSAHAFKRFSDALSEAKSLEQRRIDERANLLKQQNAIESLTKDVSLGKSDEVIAQGTVARQRVIIYGLFLLTAVTGVTSFFIYRNAKASQLANQMLALKSLRSQMNPHFIFNALNSVNQFIATQDERTANRFLSDFSLLMRSVLETSQEDFITFNKELDILNLYLKLEHHRFRDKFEYRIDVSDEIDRDRIELPPMLIQPYVENAIWHGLRYKDSKGMLLVAFRQQDQQLIAQITDDGIGRAASAQLKTEQQRKHKSSGLKNIEERVSLINTVYKAGYHVEVEDREGGGTVVTIMFPIRQKALAL